MSNLKLFAVAFWHTLTAMSREIRTIHLRYWAAMNIVAVAWFVGYWIAK